MPSSKKLEEYWSLIEYRHVAFHDVWGTIDGLKVRIEEAMDEIIHSHYNG
jgi:hypothetical protein